MDQPDRPAEFPLRNRTLILVLSPLAVLIAGERVIDGILNGALPLNWFFGLLLWLYLAALALRRRLILTTEGIEYIDVASSARYPWPQVAGIIQKKALGFWPVEGLLVRTGAPRFREAFIDLTQFERSWREGPLGSALRARAPGLIR